MILPQPTKRNGKTNCQTAPTLPAPNDLQKYVSSVHPWVMLWAHSVCRNAMAHGVCLLDSCGLARFGRGGGRRIDERQQQIRTCAAWPRAGRRRNLSPAGRVRRHNSTSSSERRTNSKSSSAVGHLHRRIGRQQRRHHVAKILRVGAERRRHAESGRLDHVLPAAAARLPPTKPMRAVPHQAPSSPTTSTNSTRACGSAESLSPDSVRRCQRTPLWRPISPPRSEIAPDAAARAPAAARDALALSRWNTSSASRLLRLLRAAGEKHDVVVGEAGQCSQPRHGRTRAIALRPGRI